MPQRGWMPDVIYIPTKYFGYSDVPAGQMQPTAVVNHIAQGFIRTIDGWARAGTNVSPHFGITRGGEIHQYVSIFDAGYHAGRLDPGRPPTWPGYQNRNPNKYTIGIEFEGFSVAPSYGYDYLYTSVRPWPEPMIEAGIRVHRWFFDQVNAAPSSQSVIGHREIAPATRAHDPGEQWPQQRMLAALRSVGPSPASLSPKLTMMEAIGLVVDAYTDREGGQEAQLAPQPMDGTSRVYQLTVRD